MYGLAAKVSDSMIEYHKGHHKHKRQDLFLPFVFIRDVRSLEPTRSRPEKRKMSGGHFSDDGRRLLLSKGSDSDHSEKIATE